MAHLGLWVLLVDSEDVSAVLNGIAPADEKEAGKGDEELDDGE